MWGKAPLESNPDGFFGHAVVDAMRRGTRIIQIDPRVNWLSARADIHLQLRSGTDTALAMAWLNIIINEGLYDHDFVEYWCYGCLLYTSSLASSSTVPYCMTPARQ